MCSHKISDFYNISYILCIYICLLIINYNIYNLFNNKFLNLTYLETIINKGIHAIRNSIGVIQNKL